MATILNTFKSSQGLSPNQKEVLPGEQSLMPLLSQPGPPNAYWYLDRLPISVLISSQQTNGAFALVKAAETKGLEAPPHIHTREDETFYLLDGEITFYVAGKELHAKKGDSVFLPRNVLHNFKVETAVANVLVLLTPGGFDNYFIEMSQPAKDLASPPQQEGPPDFEKIIRTASKYGILFHQL